jgi:hypothetical protein
VGRYLDIIARMEAQEHDQNDINDKRPTQRSAFSRLNRFGRTFSELERRCPAHVEPGRWQQAVEDSKRFLAQWGEQAEILGWSTRDLFGLHEVPASPHPSYRRLSCYDRTGLIWSLQGSPVVALTESTAAIRMPTGSILTYRKQMKGIEHA